MDILSLLFWKRCLFYFILVSDSHLDGAASRSLFKEEEERELSLSCSIVMVRVKCAPPLGCALASLKGKK